MFRETDRIDWLLETESVARSLPTRAGERSGRFHLSMNFFSELKRRNVYKVAVAYAVVGWLLVQVATQVFPVLGNSELGCSPGLRDDPRCKSLLARLGSPAPS
jgi:hypothetical protein